MIVCIGVGLRLAGLTASAIWYDEAFSLNLARLPLLTMLRTDALDFNPPLWEIITWLSTRLFGFNELGLRLPSLAASIAALLLTRQVMQLYVTNPWARLVALALVAGLPYQFWMAQDGRTYALMSLLYLAGAWFVIDGRWLGASAICGLLMYTQNTGPFYVAALLTFALVRRPRAWRGIVLAGAVAVVAFLPWLPAYLNSTGGSFWLGPLTPTLLLLAVERVFFADTLTLPFIAMAVLTVCGSCVIAASVWLVLTVQRRNANIALPVLAAGPLVLMVIVSLTWKNVIFYRPLSAMAIPLVIWFAATLWRLPVVLRTAVAYCWLLLLVLGLAGWQPQSKTGDLREVAQFINDQWQPGDVIYHATATSLLPFNEYTDQTGYLLDELQPDGLLRRSIQDAFGLQRVALEQLPHSRVWIVWARDPELTDAADARMGGYIEGGQLMAEVHAWQFSTIQVWLVDSQ